MISITPPTGPRRAWRAFACALLLTACSDTAELTQVTARIYVEPQVVDAMRSIRFRLSTQEGDDSWVMRELVTVPGSEIERYPVDVPITPRDGGTDSVFELVVDALDDEGVPLVQARAITGFIAGEVRVLELWLEVCGEQPLRALCESDPGCFGTACAVCVAGACAEITPVTPAASLLPLDADETLDPDKQNPNGRKPVQTDVCAEAPCEHGGICSASTDGAGFTCACRGGYTGTTCQTETADPCSGDPCKNGGICSATSATAFECTCTEGFEGERCETRNPCDPEPCQNGGSCSAVSETVFACTCEEGYIGDACETACSFVRPAGPPADDEVNHVRAAALFMSSARSDDAPATCDGACAARYAADGQLCGEVDKVPVAQVADPAAGERWLADWSATGARRIDRIEVYDVKGADADGLSNAQLRIDGFPVEVLPVAANSQVFVFDPPLYGSSVELQQAGGGPAMGLAEVEVWGRDEGPMRNVALHGAVRQSSVLASNEAVVSGGAMVNAGATNAVDGRFETVATTKPFLRGGATDLESLVAGMTAAAYPYDTGNRDEAPLVGSDNAWWHLALGRGQRVHAVHVVRGDNPQRLAGAQVFLEVGGALEATPRWTLPDVAAAYGDVDRLAATSPVEDVTGVKIVSAITSVDAGADPDPDASLELREVRVWADEPAAANAPLVDLSVTARADLYGGNADPGSWWSIDRVPASLHDGDTSTGANSGDHAGSWMRLDFGATRSVREVVVYKHPSYPGNFFYSPPGQGCPSIPLCGNTYGTCARRSLDAAVYALDDAGVAVDPALASMDIAPAERFSFEAEAFGIEVRKDTSTPTATAACPSGYGHENMINFHEVRVFGFPGDEALLPLNYGLSSQGASATLSPEDADVTYAVERALDGWPVDYARSAGGGEQVLTLQLRRPVRVETVRVVAPVGGVEGATLELLLDGGSWVQQVTLTANDIQDISPTGSPLVAAVRITRAETALAVGELQVLAQPAY